MQSLKALAIVALFALSSLGQSIEVKPFEAITAKSVKVEQLTDSVAVILTDREPGTKTGAYLRIASEKKWATPLLDGVTITQTSTPGEWIMFASSGKYRLLLAEFDPESGPRYSFHDLVIPGATPEPDKPADPDKPVEPPKSDYAELINVAKSIADSLADPKTRSALATAYRGANLPSLSYQDTVNAVINARRLVLSARQGESRNKDWNAWLNAVDMELKKIVQPGDKAAYSSALAAIVKALES